MAQIDVKALLNRQDKADWISSQQLISLLQMRINHEEQASRIYLAMSHWAEINGWLGTSAYLRKQSIEENQHSLEFAQFLLDCNIQPIVDILPKPPKQEFLNLKEVFTEVLKQELIVTKEINEICSQALRDSDHMVYSIGSKFMAEQQQEIASTREVIDLLDIAGDDKCALLLVDKKLRE